MTQSQAIASLASKQVIQFETDNAFRFTHRLLAARKEKNLALGPVLMLEPIARLWICRRATAINVMMAIISIILVIVETVSNAGLTTGA